MEFCFISMGITAAEQVYVIKCVYIGGCLFMGFSSIILLLEKSPLLNHAYVFMAIFLWTRIVQNVGFLKAVWTELSNMPFKYIVNLLNISVVALFILEFLVMSFFDRKLYTWCFLVLGILSSTFVALFIQASLRLQYTYGLQAGSCLHSH